MNLKMERNPYSMWKIIETLMQGRTPVISAGGGIFFSQKNAQLILRETIFNALNINVNIIALFPTSESQSLLTIENNDTFKRSLRGVYKDSETVKNAVSRIFGPTG